VTLASDVKLTAQFVDDPIAKFLVLEVIEGNKKVAIWDYRPRDQERLFERGDVFVEIDERGQTIVRRRPKSSNKRESENIPRGEQAYLEALRKHIPTLFILNADRRLDSDTVADPSDEVELRRVMQYGEPKRINELVVRSREIALSQALSTAARWISRKAVLGTNRGAMNVHSVYGDVLRKLLSPASRSDGQVAPSSVADLLKQLAYIDSKTCEHARYELATHLETNDFRKALGRRSTKKSELAAELLKPYIKSVEGRLEAVEPIYQLIDRFVTIVNGLLTDKVITFKLSQGFNIQNRLGAPLTPAQLSSGEQQLLLLFCYVLTARDTPTVFMIDEPEISLNIKWQRQLIQSLLDITSGANIQFIFASHSMELLAQHRSRVVRLVNKP
jgi:predicted ATP-dependent endonuclease of OLD family